MADRCGHFVDAHQFERVFTLDAAEPYGLGVDEGALTIARQAVEAALVEMRDRGISIGGVGNGLVILERGGHPTRGKVPIRLSTRDALRVGIQAYLRALAAGDDIEVRQEAFVVERPCQLYLPAGGHCNHWENGGFCCGCEAPRWVGGIAVLDTRAAASRTCTWRPA